MSQGFKQSISRRSRGSGREGTGLLLQTPTRTPVVSVNGIQETIAAEAGVEPEIQTTGGGVQWSLGGSVPHPVIDVAESAAQNMEGKPMTVPQKSTIKVAGQSPNKAVHLVFVPQGRIGKSQIDELKRLMAFVAGVEVTVFKTGDELHINTGKREFLHANLDVAEILVRRVGDSEGVTIKEPHIIKVGPSQ